MKKFIAAILVITFLTIGVGIQEAKGITTTMAEVDIMNWNITRTTE